MSHNPFFALYEQRLAIATREFNARGKSLIRCPRCWLAENTCICAWRPLSTSNIEFVLLMHSDEIFKPTNTGRLIADFLPQQTHAYCWHRKSPSPELLQLLNDPNRRCLLLFPVNDHDLAERPREVYHHLPSDDKINTLVLLDGTWKQSARMFHLSRWLDKHASLTLPEGLVKSYSVRKSDRAERLSTAEAAGLCLALANEQHNADLLTNYFDVFNQHYLATRGCYAPAQSEAHIRLSEHIAKQAE
ncbi:tRNA-uridine aminocarboxypropyltransferase [Saccharophagus degradans]|uniref:tRNA-uridine aminocarboxypropyltransferase n=1 Tax=Saccharophagus degradans TaxID=86304 RepID=A0AAW7X641_9GAMM|nr:DTW domain-containing protein [Saccharophagus degradans]MDO6422332.1 DTW domain-containing protein [Saccharophagus degradans]MDO6608128.1 DTW domain-containing protein [Saccharophagus degradans]